MAAVRRLYVQCLEHARPAWPGSSLRVLHWHFNVNTALEEMRENHCAAILPVLPVQNFDPLLTEEEKEALATIYVL